MTTELENGSSFIFNEKTPEKSYEVFSHHLTLGYSGLCFSDSEPKLVADKWKLNSPIIWVTEMNQSNFQTIGPARLSKINATVAEFLKSSVEKKIIFLDCMDSLLGHNDFNSLMKFLHLLNEYMAINNSLLVMSWNLRSVSEKNKGYLEREFEIFGKEFMVHNLEKLGSTAKDQADSA
jgi:hypothetical protein